MLFSVIVPIYNVEKYIHECIESILSQTYRDIEIILVDDESPDNCPAICDSYASEDNRIKVIHKKNGGLSDARNAGLKEARGEYILFVDADDYIESNTCESFSRYVNYDCDILVGDANLCGDSSGVMSHSQKPNIIYPGIDFLKQGFLANNMPMAAWLNVYKREFLEKNKLEFKFGILHEDEQFTPRAFLNAACVLYTGISFYNYRIRVNSITTNIDKRKNAFDLYNTCLELELIFVNLQDKKLKKVALDALVVKYLNIFYVANLNNYGKEYLHKHFVKKNSYRLKTRIKALLFFMSPKIYCYLNGFLKRRKAMNK